MLAAKILVWQADGAVTVDLTRYRGESASPLEQFVTGPLHAAISQAIEAPEPPVIKRGSGGVGIRRFDLTPDAWTEIRAPIACDAYVVNNPGGMILASDPADETTHQSQPAGSNPSLNLGSRTPPRFAAEDIILHAKSAGEDETITGVFVR